MIQFLVIISSPYKLIVVTGDW